MTTRSKLIPYTQTKSVSRICREIMLGILSFQNGIALCRSTNDAKQLIHMLVEDAEALSFVTTTTYKDYAYRC